VELLLNVVKKIVKRKKSSQKNENVYNMDRFACHTIKMIWLYCARNYRNRTNIIYVTVTCRGFDLTFDNVNSLLY